MFARTHKHTHTHTQSPTWLGSLWLSMRLEALMSACTYSCSWMYSRTSSWTRTQTAELGSDVTTTRWLYEEFCYFCFVLLKMMFEYITDGELRKILQTQEGKEHLHLYSTFNNLITPQLNLLTETH